MMDISFSLCNYESRRVAQYKLNELIVTTKKVSNSDFPYETKISHPDYNNGKFIVVQDYISKGAALQGHEKWIKGMTTNPLPDALYEAGKSSVVEYKRQNQND